MSTTLSHGYILPQNPDTGDIFWASLSADITLFNAHIHDGTTGTVLPTVTQAILAANWTATTGQTGTYQQTVTMPTQLSFDTCDVSFRLSNGNPIFPTVQRMGASQYIVYTNDNTQNFTAVYSS